MDIYDIHSKPRELSHIPTYCADPYAVPSRKDIQASIMEAELRTSRGRVEGSEAAWISDGLLIEEQR